MESPHFYSWSKEDIDTACQVMIPKETLTHSSTTLKAKLLDYRCVASDSQLSDVRDSAGGHKESGQESAAQQVDKHSMAMDCLKSLESAEFEIFNDPVHGSIELHPLLVSIVHTPAFNRLKNIKQLGGVHYVYPGATHTRFEHSIGTCHIAGEFVRRLQRKQPELGITDREVLLVEIAALCHDLGHGPLSYVFINEVKPRIHPRLHGKEELSSLIFEHYIFKYLEERFSSYGLNGVDSLFIQELIDHDLTDRVMHITYPERQFLYEIVANKESGIDVDKWDYIARDCHYLGIPNEFSWRRLMSLSRVIKVGDAYRICYRDKEVNNLYGMFRTRTSLFQRAYKHTTVISIEHMIGNAIYKVSKEQLLQDESTNQLVSIEGALTGVTKDPPSFGGFLALTDSIVPLILNSSNMSPEMIEAKDILRKLDRREILHLTVKDISSQQCSKDALASISNDLSTSTGEEVYIEQVKLSYCSEKAHDDKVPWNQDDPVNRVYFYKKETPWKAETGGKLFDSKEHQQSFSPDSKRSDLVIPRKFEEKETLVYSQEKKRKSMEGAYREAKRRKIDTSTASTSTSSTVS